MQYRHNIIHMHIHIHIYNLIYGNMCIYNAIYIYTHNPPTPAESTRRAVVEAWHVD